MTTPRHPHKPHPAKPKHKPDEVPAPALDPPVAPDWPQDVVPATNEAPPAVPPTLSEKLGRWWRGTS